jgi:hypothetical protein
MLHHLLRRRKSVIVPSFILKKLEGRLFSFVRKCNRSQRINSSKKPLYLRLKKFHRDRSFLSLFKTITIEKKKLLAQVSDEKRGPIDVCFSKPAQLCLLIHGSLNTICSVFPIAEHDNFDFLFDHLKWLVLKMCEILEP